MAVLILGGARCGGMQHTNKQKVASNNLRRDSPAAQSDEGLRNVRGQDKMKAKDFGAWLPVDTLLHFAEKTAAGKL
jgi:hypothetical protein